MRFMPLDLGKCRGRWRGVAASRGANRLAASVLALALSVPAGAQKPRVETFAVGAGLPSAAITAMALGPSGRIWILSQAGLTLFDGHAFSVAPAAGLPDGELGALRVDADGQVWTVARWSGPHVYRLDGHRWRPLPAPGGGESPTDGLTSLAVMPRGDRSFVAVGSARAGLWLWDGTGWRHHGATSGLPADTVAALESFGDV
ncbi:MAG: hypothetical protein GY719_27635, partial [bacterium]|nr:hypothetical protein [bacterium]